MQKTKKVWTTKPIDLKPLATMLSEMAVRRGPPNLRQSRDDMVQECLIAGSNACDRCLDGPACKGTKCSFVYARMLGAIKDWMRKQNHLTRGERVKVNAGLREDVVFVNVVNALMRTPSRKMCSRDIDLHRCVKRLPERERTIVRLVYFEGRSKTDAAKMLGVTQGRISQLHGDIMRKLEKCMTDQVVGVKT
jgi:RNA polymerase sigma factor (sigma-70 family)